MALHKRTLPRRTRPTLILLTVALCALAFVLRTFATPRPSRPTIHSDPNTVRLPADAPPFCEHLVRNPRPQNNSDPQCHGAPEDNDRSASCRRFFSQYHQDIWFWHAVARYLDHGVYVDVGANQPALISNSFFLDRCLRWQGVCVEGQLKYHSRLRQHRTCSLATCVSSKVETVAFVQADDLGGIERDNKNVNGTFEWQKKAHAAERVEVLCEPLSDVLRRQRISHVTFLSVDVEGAEIEVLKGVDWRATDIWFISVEGNINGKAGKYLSALGYVGIEYAKGVGDWFYVKPDIVKTLEDKFGVGYLQNIVIPDV